MPDLDIGAMRSRAITSALRDADSLARLGEAVDAADRDEAITWLTDGGRVVAALLPAGLADWAVHHAPGELMPWRAGGVEPGA
jgi:hypothetical protein